MTENNSAIECAIMNIIELQAKHVRKHIDKLLSELSSEEEAIHTANSLVIDALIRSDNIKHLIAAAFDAKCNAIVAANYANNCIVKIAEIIASSQTSYVKLDRFVAIQESYIAIEQADIRASERAIERISELEIELEEILTVKHAACNAINSIYKRICYIRSELAASGIDEISFYHFTDGIGEMSFHHFTV
jgi:hypothetical protein